MKALPLPRSVVFLRSVLEDPPEIHGMMDKLGITTTLQRLRDDGLAPWEAAAVVLAIAPGFKKIAATVAEMCIEQFEPEVAAELRETWEPMARDHGLTETWEPDDDDQPYVDPFEADEGDPMAVNDGPTKPTPWEYAANEDDDGGDVPF